MRQSGSVSSRRKTGRDSSTSSSLRVTTSARIRRVLPKGVTSVLQHRRNIRVIENGVDLTPKPLTHPFYSTVEETQGKQQLTAFDTISITRDGSTTQLGIISSGGPKTGSSSIVMKSSSLNINALPFPEITEGLVVSAEGGIDSSDADDSDRAPSQFCLPRPDYRYDSNVFHVAPKKVTIVIKETDTFFLFEMPQLTENLDTPEGIAMKEANERYEYMTTAGRASRKLINAETQTPRIHTKSRSTCVARQSRQNQGTFVNNWVIHDTYESPEFIKQADTEITESQETRDKFPKNQDHLENPSLEDQLARIYARASFRDGVRTMERILANNLYATALKRFEGLIKKDSCSLDLEFTYTLDLLWSHSCSVTRGRSVECFRWNRVNGNLLAVGYGACSSGSDNNGVLLVWCMKNPNQPDRVYSFDSPISDADWSHDKPNLLAIGFYDGTIRVIDVSSKDLVVIRKSSRWTSPSYSPHWQVQWWSEDEQFDYQEQIYTSNEDGRISCYRTREDFSSTEIMRIPRIEGKIGGVKRTNHSNVCDIAISRNPGALLLRRHPENRTIYLVGTEEGCLHRCSTNYLHESIDSFLVHDGPVYSLEFSPFCSKILLTCGADWCTRIWADGIKEPLISLSTEMACVRGATWCPTNSTVIASVVNNEICVWDIKRKTYRPTSITVSPNSHRFLMLEFTRDGNQLVVADVEGIIYIYSLEGMPFPPCDQTSLLVKSIEKTLTTKSGLLRKLKKIGSPF